MEKNWHIIYTKAKCEKKVISFCGKRNIEYYFPLTAEVTDENRKAKLKEQPLFGSFVFVKVSAEEMEKVMKVECVLSVMHWKSKPVVIPEEEIGAIRNFLELYPDTEAKMINVKDGKLEKRVEHINEEDPVTNGFSITKQKIIQNLPSIGYLLVAETEYQRLKVIRGVNKKIDYQF